VPRALRGYLQIHASLWRIVASAHQLGKQPYLQFLCAGAYTSASRADFPTKNLLTRIIQLRNGVEMSGIFISKPFVKIIKIYKFATNFMPTAAFGLVG
jgi:hypothetical protein